MADGTKAGGDAPRTLFSLGRSGKRKGRVAETSPLEDYPPRHADEPVTEDEVSPLEGIEGTDIEAAHAELLRDDADSASDLDIADLDSIVDDASDLDDQACPSCSEPLVAGAMFCGECGTRLTAPEDSVPAAVLLDDEVPGEPLPPEADGTFEVAEPVTGSFEDDELLDADDLAEDDGAPVEEQAVFGAFIAADDLTESDVDTDADTDAETEAEAEAEADVEAEADAESDVEAETDTEIDDAETEPAEAELVEDELEDGDDLVAEDQPEAEVVEDDTDDDAAALVVAGAAVAAGAASDTVDDSVDAELDEEGSDAATPVVPIAAATTTAAADGSGGGSKKKGVWIGMAAAAAAVVLIIGAVAMGSGGKSEDKTDDRVAAVPQKSTTTTTAATSTTASTPTTQAPSTTDTAAPVTTDTSVAPSTNTTPAPATNTTNRPFVPPPTQPVSGPNVQVDCPPTLAPGGHYAIRLINRGGTQTSFLVTWSALKTGVTVSPTTGNVGANAQAVVSVNVANGTPGSASRVTIKWSGGSTSCNLLVQ